MCEYIYLVITCTNMIVLAMTQKVAPGVHPQHYQQPQQVPQQHQQVYQQQQQHKMHQQQPVGQGHHPGQVYQSVHGHQPPPPPPQPHHAPQSHHGQPHPHQAHPHQTHPHGQQQVLSAANMQHEKQHIAEHLSVTIDTSKMSEQELQFHYFKMHDADNNNKLDGCELIKSLIHWHDQGHKDELTGQEVPPEVKLFKDEELVALIDPIINMDDANGDGYIDYTEFVRAQQRASAGERQPNQT